MSQADFHNIPALRRPHPPWKLPPPHFWSLSEKDKIVWWLDFHATQLAAENTPQHLYIAQLLSDIGLTFEDLADFRQLTHVKWNDSTNTVKKESWSWRMEGNGRLGPSDSDPASPVSRGEIGECGCLGIGQW